MLSKPSIFSSLATLPLSAFSQPRLLVGLIVLLLGGGVSVLTLPRLVPRALGRWWGSLLYRVKHLFNRTEKSKTREELLIFIQPHIMKSTDSLDGPNRIENGRSNLYEEALEFSSPRLQNIPKAVPYRGGK